MRSTIITTRLSNLQFLALVFCILQLLSTSISAFSQGQQHDSSSTSPLGISRRDYGKVSLGILGGVAYVKLVGDTLYRISQGIQRPEAHEQRVRNMISQALVASASLKRSSNTNEPFRILEVGIGTDCRLIRRGLYKNGLEELSSKQVANVELIGADPMRPSDNVVKKAHTALSAETQDLPIQVEFSATSGDVVTGLPFASGYFDSVICALTLCSVNSQQDALQEIRRLIRPNGGTFGYVEHVAVNSDEPYRFLEWQQEVFDPLQQKLADNCHLHRYTDDAIDRVFQSRHESGLGVRLQRERFLVDDMWPTACQSSGVIQLQSS